MIIIKSQDGRIISKCKTVNINYTKTNQVIADSIILGEYTSKQRALEVMGEIEKRIRELYVTDMIKHAGKLELAKEDTEDFFKAFEDFKNIAIYEMPRE